MNSSYFNNHPQGPGGDQPDAGRMSETSSSGTAVYEKGTASKTSKSYMFRMVRLGTSIALTIAVLVLTLIILISGRHGGGANDLSLVKIDMTNFARFNPPQINLVATKTRRGLFDDIGDKVGDVGDKVGSAVGSVETFASGAASKVESAVGAVATAAEAKADEIIGEIGDALDDLENAVTGLMEKILGTIQDALNKWLKEAANALGDIDIPRTMSLHLTTYCSGNDTLTGSNSTDSNSTSMSCTRLFSSGESSFNATENNGTIFGFQPGAVLAKALGVFYVPEGAQLAIREPVDNGVNTVDRLVHKAGAELSSWTVNLLFIPIVVVYVLATFFGFLLLIILAAATYRCFKDHGSIDAPVFGLCGVLAAACAFFLLLGSIILTVIGLVAYVVGLGAGVVDITVESSSQLKWMSWAAFVIMALLAISLKIQEFMANVKLWIHILIKIFGGKSKKTGAPNHDMEKFSSSAFPQRPY
ncbi:hypothetical protein KVR01_000435 [Diaporthe batatas]|uniref:uncharacterized protein n=1 Tax=Diaporthe batatas TaxID=748121 RepID=UPI001D03E24A|nr:uncharacterized protein KVR01_000435 [Diaporthe batatas]KAG8169690.1 hypothetical protein KVR01_000435 [Diaporthe batatas]